MNWLDDFLAETSFSQTDKTDKSTFLINRMRKDKSILENKGVPRTDKTDKSAKSPEVGSPAPSPQPLETSSVSDLEARLRDLGIRIAIDRATGSALPLFKESDADIVKDVADIYQPGEVELTPSQRVELSVAVDHYERVVNIAVFEDGAMRVMVTERDSVKALGDGGTVYSPQDMYHYVTLSPSERLMLHSFKKRFGGTTEWRQQ